MKLSYVEVAVMRSLIHIGVSSWEDKTIEREWKVCIEITYG